MKQHDDFDFGSWFLIILGVVVVLATMLSIFR